MVNDIDTPPPLPPRAGIPVGVPADIDLEEIDLGPNYHPDAVVDKREVSHLSSLITDLKALDVQGKGSKAKEKPKAPGLEEIFGDEEEDFHQPRNRLLEWKRKKEELPEDLRYISDEQAIRYFHQRPVFRYLAIGIVAVVASVAAAIELTKKTVTPLEVDRYAWEEVLEATLPPANEVCLYQSIEQIDIPKKAATRTEDPSALIRLVESTLSVTEYQNIGNTAPLPIYNLPEKKTSLQQTLRLTAPETTPSIQAPLERTAVNEYVTIPCDDDPECFGLKLRVSELEAQLNSPAEKVFVPIYERVEVPCEDDPICSQYQLNLAELEAKANQAPKTVVVKETIFPSCDEDPECLEWKLITTNLLAQLSLPKTVTSYDQVMPENGLTEANNHPKCCAQNSKRWYERFQTFNKQKFRAAFFEYVTYFGKKQAIQEINRETLFFSFAGDRLNTPEYDLQKRLFNERVFQYIGTNPKEVIACVTHPKSCQ